MTRQCVRAVVPVLLAASPLFASPTTAPATAPAAASAADAARVDSWDVSQLGRTTLGEVWSGPDLRREDLRGKVVLLEFWGHNCPPCIRSMPHLAQLHARHAGSGLVVIGAHVGASAREKALAIVKRTGVSYTILSGAFVPGLRLTHIPLAVVFDPRGRLVHRGSPDGNMDQAVLRALASRTHPLLGGRTYPTMARAVARIKAGRLGEAWQICQAGAAAEGKAGQEARELLASLDRHARRRLDRARRTRAADPTAAAAILRKLAADYRGAPPAAEAERLLKEMSPKRASKSPTPV